MLITRTRTQALVPRIQAPTPVRQRTRAARASVHAQQGSPCLAHGVEEDRHAEEDANRGVQSAKERSN